MYIYTHVIKITVWNEYFCYHGPLCTQYTNTTLYHARAYPSKWSCIISHVTHLATPFSHTPCKSIKDYEYNYHHQNIIQNNAKPYLNAICACWLTCAQCYLNRENRKEINFQSTSLCNKFHFLYLEHTMNQSQLNW